MPDRILNFSEFFNKYSKKSNKENSLDTIISSPQNFEDGFDETTYGKTELGPNKPINHSYQSTPANSNKFNIKKDETMEAPEEETDEENIPEPEKMGANPTKQMVKPKTSEEVKEGKILSFDRFTKTNEDYSFNPERYEEEEEESRYRYSSYGELSGEQEDEFWVGLDPRERPKFDSDIFGANPSEEDIYEEDMCPSCGRPKMGTYTASANPGMKTCSANPMKSCGSNPY
jgi:hypothetical protein